MGASQEPETPLTSTLASRSARADARIASATATRSKDETAGTLSVLLPLMAQNRKPTFRQADEALLDTTDLRLLDELQDDARMSLAELGRRVGLSSPAVAERIRRLETAGVIRGYHAEVDPRRLGYQLGVVIRIRPAPRQLTEVAKLAHDTPEVIECNRVTGDDCYVITAHVRDVDHLEAVIDEFAAYGQTTSSVMQSAPVPRRPISTRAARPDVSRPQRRRASGS